MVKTAKVISIKKVTKKKYVDPMEGFKKPYLWAQLNLYLLPNGEMVIVETHGLWWKEFLKKKPKFEIESIKDRKIINKKGLVQRLKKATFLDSF